ncbi:Tumor necrosis factor receptor superfamily member 5 [Oryzias melastigma]|uniref:Tumor necrosis factor receptor superfamily member 5 n=1 Tax=Oryzias melastigma TaxID=30732 RepID=A0A834FJD9_ORYME|nr:Tumor necrosis factor receptor superfamily member 5 [Oryzias melastigma]
MQLLHHYMFFLLCGLHVLPSGASVQCNDKQYAWPLDNPSLCCNKCEPGYKMKGPRIGKTCNNECIPCEGERFSDSYNVEMSCKVCETCDKPNMGYKSKCNPTHGAVCKCNPGYTCKDQACTQCVREAPPKKPTSPPSTTAIMSYKPKCNSSHGTMCKCNPGYRCQDKVCTLCVLATHDKKPPSPPSTPVSKTAGPTPPEKAPKQVGDTVFPLVIISLLCIGIALLAVAKMKPFLQWIRSHTVYIVTDNPAEKPLRTEDEDMPKPVQEVCGKCDQCIDICVKD